MLTLTVCYSFWDFQQQYRRLWQLRATLEEDEKPNVKQHSQGATVQPATAAPAPAPAPAAPAPAPAPAPSSPDQSPGTWELNSRHCPRATWTNDIGLLVPDEGALLVAA